MDTVHWCVRLSESRRLVYYLHTLHLCLVATLFLLPLSVFYFSVLLGLIVVHWRYVLWRYSSKSAGWIEGLEFHEGRWLITVAAQHLPVQLTQATVWSWLLVLNFRECDSRKRYSCVIFNDSSCQHAQRQLRVMLRHLPVWG